MTLPAQKSADTGPETCIEFYKLHYSMHTIINTLHTARIIQPNAYTRRESTELHITVAKFPRANRISQGNYLAFLLENFTVFHSEYTYAKMCILLNRDSVYILWQKLECSCQFYSFRTELRSFVRVTTNWCSLLWLSIMRGWSICLLSNLKAFFGASICRMAHANSMSMS